ncbi:hypothetical protein EMIT093MI4_40115 [Pseudomonas sp. IT-93MI4]
MLKNTTDGRVILSSSSAIIVSMPGRSQPTVELEVPKSIPQARAGEALFMSFGFRSKNGRAVYVSARQIRRPVICYFTTKLLESRSFAPNLLAWAGRHTGGRKNRRPLPINFCCATRSQS